MTTTAPAPTATAPSPAAAATTRRRRSAWGYLATPTLLVAVVAALAIWISASHLDWTSAQYRQIRLDTLLRHVLEHVELTVVSTALVLIIAIPLGVVLTRGFTRRFRGALLTVANIGQAVPTIGVLALLAVLWLLLGFWPAIIGLVAYAILPVLQNTMVGLDQVDADILEAGRGMGMSKMRVLLRLELPLAVPVMLAGVRTALVINVGTATLATYIGAGGLGDVIVAGLSLNRTIVTTTGAALTAVLALLLDYLAGLAEDFLRPKGL